MREVDVCSSEHEVIGFSSAVLEYSRRDRYWCRSDNSRCDEMAPSLELQTSAMPERTAPLRQSAKRYTHASGSRPPGLRS